MKYSAYGTNETPVLNCLDRYNFGALTEIIDAIDFYKGRFKFAFKTPAGAKSWRQWLYLNEMYPELNALLKALHKADDMQDEHVFEDFAGTPFANIAEPDSWRVNYIK